MLHPMDDQAQIWMCMFLRILWDKRYFVKICTLLAKDLVTTKDVQEGSLHCIEKKNHVGRSFRLNVFINGHEVDDAMLDFGSNINILTKKSWEIMGP